MLVWMHNETRNLVHFDLSTVSWSNLRLYDFLYSLIFGVDLLFATVGYGLSLRVIDAHIRTAEPTMYGWVVALFCYQPFYSLMEPSTSTTTAASPSSAWLAPWPPVRWVWAGGISSSSRSTSLRRSRSACASRTSRTAGSSPTARTGSRSTRRTSRRTSRGGCVTIPFIPHGGWEEAIRHSLLLGVHQHDLLLARQDRGEAPLARPAYVAYALWMNDHGTLRFLDAGSRSSSTSRRHGPSPRWPSIRARPPDWPDRRARPIRGRHMELEEKRAIVLGGTSASASPSAGSSPPRGLVSPPPAAPPIERSPRAWPCVQSTS